jgi:hypothetical protein
MGSAIIYFIIDFGIADFKLLLLVPFSSLLIIYAFIGHKLKGEGNFYTEDVVQATKRDTKLIFKKDDKN